MNNLVTYTNFVGSINIPNIKSDIIGFDNVYIAPYQQKILEMLLGIDLYLAFETGLAESVIAQKWVDLRDGCIFEIEGVKFRNPGVKNIVANYVFCNWLVVNSEQTTGLGVTVSKSENANIISPENKITEIWNSMYNLYYTVAAFLDSKPTDYPKLSVTEIKRISYGI